MKYEVAVIERLRRVETVEAESPEEALRIVNQLYDDEKIKLDYRDYDGYKIMLEKKHWSDDLKNRKQHIQSHTRATSVAEDMIAYSAV